MTKLSNVKIFFVISLIVVYFLFGIGVKLLVMAGSIEPLPPTPVENAWKDSLDDIVIREIEAGGIEEGSIELAIAQTYFQDNFVRDDGHVYLYLVIDENATFEEDLATNSEAMSYYLLWSARDGDKLNFDRALTYVQDNMLHPQTGHMMWRVNEDGTATSEGRNIASDADLRAIHALMVAEDKWGDLEYTRMITTLAEGLEKVGITSDGYLAPYGGASGEDDFWVAREVWLSYVNFIVIEELAERRGGPWQQMHDKMKEAVLGAQLHNGLYNSMLTEQRAYGNGIEGGGYSINSMWVMVRSAESNDPELRASARESLNFYKEKYTVDAALYAKYSSNGDALSPDETPWVYALVGRAAVALGEKEFASVMMAELSDHQVWDDQSEQYGAIIEGAQGNRRIGQFTMQESILTLQAQAQT